MHGFIFQYLLDIPQKTHPLASPGKGFIRVILFLGCLVLGFLKQNPIYQSHRLDLQLIFFAPFASLRSGGGRCLQPPNICIVTECPGWLESSRGSLLAVLVGFGLADV